MNEIRQLCLNSLSPGKRLDDILALFHACPPEQLLPSLSLIGQSVSCMPVEQLDINMINHPLFLLIRQWSERLLRLWLVNGTLNGDEYRALFYTHQLFQLFLEWLNQQNDSLVDPVYRTQVERVMTNVFVDETLLNTVSRVIRQLISIENDEQHAATVDSRPVGCVEFHATSSTAIVLRRKEEIRLKCYE